MAVRIPVNVANASYDIVIEPRLLDNIGDRAGDFGLDGRVMVVTNTTVGPLYGERLVKSLPNASLVVVPDGEKHKTLETVAGLYDSFLDRGADRHITVVALGGGVIGDTAGFVAATYMRGVRLIQMPTSLLAMVDASVGGKVGVDLAQGKNLVGAFKQPEAVLVDPEVLRSLPAEEWRCGMAETLKHGFLADEGLLNPGLHNLDQSAALVKRAIQVKVDVVHEDPFEHGIRAHLNLGHTFGHAIEQVTNYAWSHGDAVGVGMLAAAHLSARLGLCDGALVARVDSVLAQAGLPRQLHGLDPEMLYAAMATDKKWKDGRSRFVLLRGIGDPCIVDDVEPAVVLEVLQTIA